MRTLNNGDIFPPLTVYAVGGGTISLPGDLAGSFGVLLIYLGVRRREAWERERRLESLAAALEGRAQRDEDA